MIVKISSRKTGAMIENSSALVPRSRRPRRRTAGAGSGVGTLLDLVGVVFDDPLDDPGDDKGEDDDDRRDDGPLDRGRTALVEAFTSSPVCAGMDVRDDRPGVEQFC
jgi:hypothetical protein